jgi:hypothetical protein
MSDGNRFTDPERFRGIGEVVGLNGGRTPGPIAIDPKDTEAGPFT